MQSSNAPRTASQRAITAARRVLKGKDSANDAARRFAVSTTLVCQALRIIAEDPLRARAIARGTGTVSAAMTQNSGARRVPVKVTPDLYERLRAMAELTGEGIIDHVNRAVTDYLDRCATVTSSANGIENG